MRDDKYFYPEIEDIFVGYECESTNNGEHWYKWKFEQHNFPALDLEILNNMYRTQYLTKEQLENEGWKVEGVYPDGSVIMILGDKSKGWEFLLPSKGNNTIITKLWEIHSDEYKRSVIYKGECKDINTFYKLKKLLKIWME